MSARPTMNDVARVAGVSLKTVSRVVNRESGVSASLSAQVTSAISELGYRHDLQASMLRRADRRTGTIGLLLEDVGNPFSAALHRAVEDVARSFGTHVLIGSVDGCPAREEELATAFMMRRVDGMIVVPSGFDHLVGDTPVVYADRPGFGMPADTVLATNAFGAASAVRHLMGFGHRRIACVGDFDRVATARMRRDGFVKATSLFSSPAGASPVISGVRTADEATAAVRALLAREVPPTALFCAQAAVTVGAVRALRDLGLQRQVALIGFDDIPLADLLDPGVSVVAQDPVRMGRTAAEMLFRRIAGDSGPPVEAWIPTRLVARGSGELTAA